MIGGFTSSILVAFISSPIRIIGIVKQTTIRGANRQRHLDFQWSQRSNRSRNQQMTTGRLNRPASPDSLYHSSADREQIITTQGRIDDSVRSSHPSPGDQQVGVESSIFQPIPKLKRFGRSFRQTFPRNPILSYPRFIQQAQQSYPQHLDLDRIPFPGSAGRMIGVHPGKMRGAPDQAGIRVHSDAVRGPLEIAQRDTAQHLADGPSLSAGSSAGSQRSVQDLRSLCRIQVGAYHPEP